jgi:hypothetical protein
MTDCTSGSGIIQDGTRMVCLNASKQGNPIVVVHDCKRA